MIGRIEKRGINLAGSDILSAKTEEKEIKKEDGVFLGGILILILC